MCVDRLPGRARIAAAQAGADLGRVAGKVLADDVQAELAQDRGGGFSFEKELERCPDELARGDVTAPEAGGKTGRHAHLVAGARGCLDAEGATGLLGDGDLRHPVTLASQQSMRGWPRPEVPQVPSPSGMLRAHLSPRCELASGRSEGRSEKVGRVGHSLAVASCVLGCCTRMLFGIWPSRRGARWRAGACLSWLS